MSIQIIKPGYMWKWIIADDIGRIYLSHFFHHTASDAQEEANRFDPPHTVLGFSEMSLIDVAPDGSEG
jgi:hypothetical protein